MLFEPAVNGEVDAIEVRRCEYLIVEGSLVVDVEQWGKKCWLAGWLAGKVSGISVYRLEIRDPTSMIRSDQRVEMIHEGSKQRTIRGKGVDMEVELFVGVCRTRTLSSASNEAAVV